jgi:uronate dehydrogenase
MFVVRIGNADPQVGDERSLRMWTSAGDLSALFALGLRLRGLEHEIVYGSSLCPDALFDNRRAFELGYAPRDRAEDHLAPGYLGRSDMGPERGPRHVGGAYAVAPLPSPAARP